MGRVSAGFFTTEVTEGHRGTSNGTLVILRTFRNKPTSSLTSPCRGRSLGPPAKTRALRDDARTVAVVLEYSIKYEQKSPLLAQNYAREMGHPRSLWVILFRLWPIVFLVGRTLRTTSGSAPVAACLSTAMGICRPSTLPMRSLLRPRCRRGLLLLHRRRDLPPAPRRARRVRRTTC